MQLLAECIIAGLEYGMDGHCKHLARAGSILQSRLSYLLWLYRAIIWVWLCKTTSAAAQAVRLALSFVLSLLSLCSFCSAVLQCAPSCWILSYLYSSAICRVLNLHQVTSRTLWYHTNHPKASLREHDGSISSTPQIYVENMAATAEKYTCINFSNFSQHDYWNTNVIYSTMY